MDRRKAICGEIRRILWDHQEAADFAIRIASQSFTTREDSKRVVKFVLLLQMLGVGSAITPRDISRRTELEELWKTLQVDVQDGALLLEINSRITKIDSAFQHLFVIVAISLRPDRIREQYDDKAAAEGISEAYWWEYPAAWLEKKGRRVDG